MDKQSLLDELKIDRETPADGGFRPLRWFVAIALLAGAAFVFWHFRPLQQVQALTVDTSVAQAPQQPAALEGGGPAPMRLVGAAGRGDGAIDIVRAAARDLGERLAIARIDHGDGLAGQGRPPIAVAEYRRLGHEPVPPPASIAFHPRLGSMI